MEHIKKAIAMMDKLAELEKENGDASFILGRDAKHRNSQLTTIQFLSSSVHKAHVDADLLVDALRKTVERREGEVKKLAGTIELAEAALQSAFQALASRFAHTANAQPTNHPQSPEPPAT